MMPPSFGVKKNLCQLPTVTCVSGLPCLFFVRKHSFFAKMTLLMRLFIEDAGCEPVDIFIGVSIILINYVIVIAKKYQSKMFLQIILKLTFF